MSDWDVIGARNNNAEYYVPLSLTSAYFKKIPTEESLLVLVLVEPSIKSVVVSSGEDFDWSLTIESEYPEVARSEICSHSGMPTI